MTLGGDGALLCHAGRDAAGGAGARPSPRGTPAGPATGSRPPPASPWRRGRWSPRRCRRRSPRRRRTWPAGEWPTALPRAARPLPPAVSGPGGERVGVAAAAGVVSAVRASGGTVVATGGCFDLLHAGHVATLQAARQLGDCLVVCLNSDASVSRAEGPGPAGDPAGRPRPAARGAELRRRGHDLRRGRPRTRRCRGCGRTSGSRAATTPVTAASPPCPRRRSCAAGAATPWWCRTWTAAPRPG